VPKHIHHVDIRVSDIDASRTFYESALAPLGLRVTSTDRDPNGGAEIVFGEGQSGDFAIHEPTAGTGQDTVTTGAHVAFAAADRQTVGLFYDAALLAGGRSIGAPGPRPEYSEQYYGAFVLDPDGNNIEAVCHDHRSV
jgi:catechol 2,3-dioxygenase-like lactoylglutathione lyase family enzyme